MPWERNLKSLAFPFYTYTRKALPTLLEQMYINPHLFSTANRFMQYRDGSAADNFNFLNISNWMRDMGFANLTDEEEPLMLTGDILPTNALDILSSNSIPEASQDLLQNLSPMMLAPIELGMGREAFNNQPIEDGTLNYLEGKIPLVGDIQDFGQRFNDPWKWMSERFMGAGIPIRRLTSGQQNQQMETNFDQLVESPLKNFNYSQDRFTINMTSQGTFSVYDKVDDRRLAEFATPEQAIQWAKNNLPMYQAPQQNAFQPPTQDFMNQTYRALTGG
jgi:hypothetical protein